MIDSLYVVFVVLSGLVFVYYGAAVFFSDSMIAEFERFGLSKFRRFTGALELLGGIALLVSLVFPPLAILAASGLALLMALGIVTRIRVKDSLANMAPAGILLALNLAIVFLALQSRSLL